MTSRRQLLKTLGGGILVLVVGPASLGTELRNQRGRAQATLQKLSAWVHIAESGVVTVFTGKVEVGQNARTSITQAAAEELRVAPSVVRVVMGDTDLVPFDMGTFGSLTTPRMIPQIRRAAAAARERLIDIGAAKSGQARSSLHAHDGKVIGPGFSASYASLAAGDMFALDIPADLELTPAQNWKVLGTSLPKVSASAIVTGTHQYTSDLRRPNMVYAKVLRPPTMAAKLKTVDTSKAAALPGVKVVRDGDFVAVTAASVRLAVKALELIEADWTEVEQSQHSELFKLLRGAEPLPTTATGPKLLAGTYTCEYIAHVPLEPRAALAEWDGKRMTIHTGTQRPFAVRDDVAAAVGLATGAVRVIVPDTGSGYGGKHTGEAAIEAARIAHAVGVPVKLVWTRQEELGWAYFRPAGVSEITSGVDDRGKVVGWTHDNYNSGPASVESPYAIDTKRSQFHPANSPLRQGSYRSLAACFNTFARETHMDELAALAGVDPLAFRIQNLDNARLRAVLEAAAAKLNWTQKVASAGRGFGIACGTDKGSYVATAVELTVAEGNVRLVRIVVAYDCGAILNPDLLKNQVVGGVIMGIGGALYETIDFANGKVLTDRLAKYRVPRHHDIPVIDCVLLDRKDLPSAGAGETPIIGIAPAIGNAIFNATGKRLRSMPLKLS